MDHKAEYGILLLPENFAKFQLFKILKRTAIWFLEN